MTQVFKQRQQQQQQQLKRVKEETIRQEKDEEDAEHIQKKMKKKNQHKRSKHKVSFKSPTTNATSKQTRSLHKSQAALLLEMEKKQQKRLQQLLEQEKEKMKDLEMRHFILTSPVNSSAEHAVLVAKERERQAAKVPKK